MKLDLSPIREAGSKLREAAAKESLSDDFRQTFLAYMDATDKFFTTLQAALVRPTSQNSNLSPSADLTRGATPHEKSPRKSGDQPGHTGHTLEAFAHPDKIVGSCPKSLL